MFGFFIFDIKIDFNVGEIFKFLELDNLDIRFLKLIDKRKKI